MSWNPSSAPVFLAWLGLPLALGMTLGLARWARKRGFLDAAEGRLALRKLQSSPVPPVGGLALFLSLALLRLVQGSGAAWELGLPGHSILVAPGVVWLSLGLVLAVGLWDDLTHDGLEPQWKLFGQALALLPLAMGAAGAMASQAGDPEAGLWPGLQGLWVLGLGLLALNVLNTFDNADGSVAGVASLGFMAALLAQGIAGWGSPQAGLCALSLGFLVCNLNAKRGTKQAAGAPGPSAYLGDSGAFLLALLLLFDPVARFALWIPSLDLARLSVLRLRAGGRPWIGDRRHLAHRLQRLGLDARAVTLVLVLLSLPACLGALARPQESWSLPLGLFLGALGFVAAVWFSRRGALPADIPVPRKR